MTAREFTLYLLMSGACVIALRWLALGVYELARGVNAVHEVRPESEGSDER